MEIALLRQLEIEISLPEPIGDVQTTGSSHGFSLENRCQRTKSSSDPRDRLLLCNLIQVVLAESNNII